MSNRFALLADDGDSGDERPLSVPKVSAKAAYGDKNAPKKATPGPNNANANQQAGSGRRDQFPGRMGQGRKVLQEEITDGQGKDNTKRNAGGRGRGNARGRGGRSARPDRHSQTGKETSDKAEAQAWGGHEGQRELDDETNAQNDADREATASGVATPADPNAPSTPAPVEEDDKTQSYSEYLAAQVAATGESLAEKLGLSTARRQANEGADDSQWKNAKAFAKEEEDNDFFTGEAKEKKGKKSNQKEKTFIEIDGPAYRPQTGGRGRGRGNAAPRGASRGRGSGGRGGNTNGTRAQRGAEPNLSEGDFPSLS